MAFFEFFGLFSVEKTLIFLFFSQFQSNNVKKLTKDAGEKVSRISDFATQKWPSFFAVTKFLESSEK